MSFHGDLLQSSDAITENCASELNCIPKKFAGASTASFSQSCVLQGFQDGSCGKFHIPRKPFSYFIFGNFSFSKTFYHFTISQHNFVFQVVSQTLFRINYFIVVNETWARRTRRFPCVVYKASAWAQKATEKQADDPHRSEFGQSIIHIVFERTGPPRPTCNKIRIELMTSHIMNWSLTVGRIILLCFAN